MLSISSRSNRSVRGCPEAKAPRAPIRISQRRLAATNGDGPTNTEAPSSSGPDEPPVFREYKAWGVKVIESSEPLPAGPEAEKDFWEGDTFQNFGVALENYFLPVLLALGIALGFYASSTYDNGATVLIEPASGPDALPIVVTKASNPAPPPA